MQLRHGLLCRRKCALPFAGTKNGGPAILARQKPLDQLNSFAGLPE
jgi:hypothetical protein